MTKITRTVVKKLYEVVVYHADKRGVEMHTFTLAEVPERSVRARLKVLSEQAGGEYVDHTLLSEESALYEMPLEVFLEHATLAEKSTKKDNN